MALRKWNEVTFSLARKQELDRSRLRGLFAMSNRLWLVRLCEVMEVWRCYVHRHRSKQRGVLLAVGVWSRFEKRKVLRWLNRWRVVGAEVRAEMERSALAEHLLLFESRLVESRRRHAAKSVGGVVLRVGGRVVSWVWRK